MDRIAEIAAISRAALYQYVASTEEAARLVLLALQDLTLAMPSGGSAGRSPLEAIINTNRYYIDYFEKNAVFMERVRELRETLPVRSAQASRCLRSATMPCNVVRKCSSAASSIASDSAMKPRRAI